MRRKLLILFVLVRVVPYLAGRVVVVLLRQADAEPEAVGEGGEQCARGPFEVGGDIGGDENADAAPDVRHHIADREPVFALAAAAPSQRDECRELGIGCAVGSEEDEVESLRRGGVVHSR